MAVFMSPVQESRPCEMGAQKDPWAGGGVSAPHRLQDGSEARGQLLSVSCADGCALASFKWGSVAFPEELEPKLAGLVGQTVAVLRMDGKYHVRAV